MPALLWPVTALIGSGIFAGGAWKAASYAQELERAKAELAVTERELARMREGYAPDAGTANLYLIGGAAVAVTLAVVLLSRR